MKPRSHWSPRDTKRRDDHFPLAPAVGPEGRGRPDRPLQRAALWALLARRRSLSPGVRGAAPGTANPPAAVGGHATAGFTMIEIALSLAIIGFALVAIIGILPYGLGVQRENTEETIINHEASVLLDAVCNGQQGLDDLTNYVAAITNYQTILTLNGQIASVPNPQRVNWYTTTSSGAFVPPATALPTLTFALTNGNRIVGLLSTPKYVTLTVPQEGTFYISNHVVATIRAMTGLASDKFPQANADVRDMAFTYRVTTEVVPYGSAAPLTNTVLALTNINSFIYQDWTNWTAYTNPPIADSNQWIGRYNYYLYVKNLEQDIYDVRLLFRWPVTPQGLGKGRQVVRSVASGAFLSSVQPGYAANFPAYLPYTLYYAQPNLFFKAP